MGVVVVPSGPPDEDHVPGAISKDSSAAAANTEKAWDVRDHARTVCSNLKLSDALRRRPEEPVVKRRSAKPVGRQVVVKQEPSSE